MDPESPINSNVPLTKVQQLRAQGTPNNQIIQILQSEGYSSDQIFNAMNQADMSQNIGQGMAETAVSPEDIENPMAMQPQSYDQLNQSYGNPNRDMIEETTEAVINEKWQEVNMKLEKMEDWRNKLEKRMSNIETEFKNIQTNFDKLHQAIIAKVGEYDQNIINVGTEIKAMEKVFQKILPTFTENVNELSRLTERMKKSN